MSFNPLDIVSGANNMLDSFLHPERAYKAAAEQAQKYYLDAQGKLQPYVDQGQAQYGRLNDQATQLNNPVNLQNSWAASYNESPEAHQVMMDAQNAGLLSASSQGLLGSSAALDNSQHSAAAIGNQYRQQYLNDLMQKYMASIGIGQNIYGAGANAAGAQSANAINQGESMANLKGREMNAPGETFAKLLQLGATAAVNYATGGVGGAAMGAAAGGGGIGGVSNVNLAMPNLYNGIR